MVTAVKGINIGFTFARISGTKDSPTGSKKRKFLLGNLMFQRFNFYLQ
jgi:hypothetical protein